MTTVDEAREALLGGTAGKNREALADALIAAVRAEYEKPTVTTRRITGGWDSNLTEQNDIKVPEAAQELAALREAVRKADETMACMWSYNEESRANLAHTCTVQASDILRAALAATPAEDGSVLEQNAGDIRAWLASHPLSATPAECAACARGDKRPHAQHAATPAEDPWIDLDGDREAQQAATPAEDGRTYVQTEHGVVDTDRA